MLNGIKKLKEGSGRMAIIQNGSSLFTGDAGSGSSEIRRYVLEGDMVEAIIQLPTDLFIIRESPLISGPLQKANL